MPRRKGAGGTSRGSQTINMETLSFGQTFRALRMKRAFSQTSIARALDRSTSFISLIETDQRRPNRQLIDHLAEALGLSDESDGKTALLRAAGYDPTEISGMITRLVAAISNEISLGESQRLRITADLNSQVNGWITHFKLQKLLVEGKFDAARTGTIEALDQHYLSPTLHTSLLITLADTRVHEGDLVGAEKAIDKVAVSIRGNSIAPDWVLTATAESLALQGMIAVDQNNYHQGKMLIEQSIAYYQRLLPNENGMNEDIAFIGIGSSYKRLAEIAMLQGEPGSALTYCLSAESYLLRANLSDEQKRWLRRTREQLAWAYTKLGEFQKAISLRTLVRNELKELGDDYGLMRNHLYTGNDYLSQIKVVVREALKKHPPSTSPRSINEARRNTILNALKKPSSRKAHGDWPLSFANENAEADYRKALEDLEKNGHQMLIGLCLSNLGAVLRYKAILTEDVPQENGRTPSEEARDLLVRALTVEHNIGQPRRIAAVFESLADLQFDQAQPESLQRARFFYSKALKELDDYRDISDDPAMDAQRDRLRDAIHDVNTAIENLDYKYAQPPLLLPLVKKSWQQLCRELLQITQNLAASHEAERPIIYSNTDDEWIKRICAIERLVGGRRILQDGLSDGLAAMVRAGFSARSADRHEARFRHFSNAIERARASSEQAFDLCCRAHVEYDLRQTYTADLTRAQIKQAYEWMKSYHDGYCLESSTYEVPLSFYVKGPYILFEIPAEVASSILSPQQSSLPISAIVCYTYKNWQYADKLRALFNRFVECASDIRSQSPNCESTTDWLKRLIQPTKHNTDPFIIDWKNPRQIIEA